ncbi:MAG: hypothetical protein IT176_13305 [Acidobacteria bacterium]|nr:hypothetical protein [Acidobacteriota bacterium]
MIAARSTSVGTKRSGACSRARIRCSRPCYPALLDGGFVTAPRWGLYGTRGEWEVENVGIAPDVEVDQDPALVRKGHDPQLERAVAVVLDLLKTSPPPRFQRPPYPDYKQRLPKTP